MWGEPSLQLQLVSALVQGLDSVQEQVPSLRWTLELETEFVVASLVAVKNDSAARH